LPERARAPAAPNYLARHHLVPQKLFHSTVKKFLKDPRKF
jgi:hypothetical protein